jgi:hypothetical protein
MKKIALLTVFAMASFAKSWTGVIVDEGCGMKHADGKGAGCVKGCVTKKGQAPVLTVDGKVIKIANPDALKAKGEWNESVLGVPVKVNGKLSKDGVLTIKKVTVVS